jgi:hypothetical protein
VKCLKNEEIQESFTAKSLKEVAITKVELQALCNADEH